MSKVIKIGASFTLSKDGFGYWMGQMPLPSWAGYTHEPDNTAYVEIQESQDREDGAPSPTQQRACVWLLTHEAMMAPPSSPPTPNFRRFMAAGRRKQPS